MSGRSDPVGAPSARGLWALGFVVVSLAALVAVPAYYGQQVAAAEARIAEVLQPAARLSSSLRLIKARQMARVERYLTTGDRSLRLAYDAARVEEDEVRARLRDLAREVDRQGEDEEVGREVSERVARLTSLSTDWHLFIEGILNPGPAVGIVPLGDPVTRARLLDGYSALESATRELDLAIQSRVDRARLEMERLLAVAGDDWRCSPSSPPSSSPAWGTDTGPSPSRAKPGARMPCGPVVRWTLCSRPRVRGSWASTWRAVVPR